MDVVKRTIEGLRGKIDLASTAASGTEITLRLPLTTAIIDGLMVRVGQGRYVMPLGAVEECVELPRRKIPARGRTASSIFAASWCPSCACGTCSRRARRQTAPEDRDRVGGRHESRHGRGSGYRRAPDCDQVADEAALRHRDVFRGHDPGRRCCRPHSRYPASCRIRPDQAKKTSGRRNELRKWQNWTAETRWKF